jgi:hypothetical protein
MQFTYTTAVTKYGKDSGMAGKEMKTPIGPMLRAHGGGCCGMRHLAGFAALSTMNDRETAYAKITYDPPVTREHVTDALRDCIVKSFRISATSRGIQPCGDPNCATCAPRRKTKAELEAAKAGKPAPLRLKNYLIEAVLNHHQWSDWENILYDVGFNLVSEFVNGNSGNTCRVYHIESGTLGDK